MAYIFRFPIFASDIRSLPYKIYYLPVLSDSFGINLKDNDIWPNDIISCYEIAIAKKTNSINNVSRKTSRLFIKSKNFYGLRYGFKW